MTFKMSEQVQTIKIFNLRSDTNEFIGAGDAYIPPHTGLPAIRFISPNPARCPKMSHQFHQTVNTRNGMVRRG